MMFDTSASGATNCWVRRTNVTNVPTVSVVENGPGGPAESQYPPTAKVGGERETGEQLHPRPVDVVEPEDRHRALEVLLRGGLDAVALVGLGVGGLDEFDTGEGVFERRVEVADDGALGDVPRLDRPHEPHREEDHQGMTERVTTASSWL